VTDPARKAPATCACTTPLSRPRPAGTGQPINLNLELTDLCNIACRMCGQADNPKVHNLQPNSFMSWEVWKAAIDSLESYQDEVHLCPHWLGEPALHPQFDRFVRYAFEQNRGNRLFRYFKLHTNGSLLGPERIDTLLDCANTPGIEPDTFRFVHFSVDAWTPATYHRIKRYDYGERVYRNIVRLLERRVARGLRWPFVTVAFIVMPENRHEADWFRTYWTGVFERLGLDYDLFYDWPSREVDNLYFRRLHQADQATADRLHREVLDQLGILPLGADGGFIEDSF
jgi:hypothetical protein